MTFITSRNSALPSHNKIEVFKPFTQLQNYDNIGLGMSLICKENMIKTEENGPQQVITSVTVFTFLSSLKQSILTCSPANVHS